MCIGAGRPTCCVRSRMKLDTCVRALLLLQLLHMLISCMVPKGPFSSIAVTSGCWMFICFQKSVSMLVFISNNNLVLSGWPWCVCLGI